jgi:hypothetical protein
MGSYLQQYGAGDEQRIRRIKLIFVVLAAIVVVALLAYLLLKDRQEKKVVEHFLGDVNAHRYEDAYRDWGCTAASPCRDYNYTRFLEDWGPAKKIDSGWKIASTDSCKAFLTVNVQAEGAELQSLMVERGTSVMGFAPAPECQERKWRFGQFFRRLMNRGS